MKQVIILRKDLKLSAGKAAAQACHASLGAYKKATGADIKKWEAGGAKKVVLAAADEKQLMKIFATAKNAKLPTVLIKDAGLTEVSAGTLTAVGIGPAADAKIDKIVAYLKLY